MRRHVFAVGQNALLWYQLHLFAYLCLVFLVLMSVISEADSDAFQADQQGGEGIAWLRTWVINMKHILAFTVAWISHDLVVVTHVASRKSLLWEWKWNRISLALKKWLNTIKLFKSTKIGRQRSMFNAPCEPVQVPLCAFVHQSRGTHLSKDGKEQSMHALETTCLVISHHWESSPAGSGALPPSGGNPAACYVTYHTPYKLN